MVKVDVPTARPELSSAPAVLPASFAQQRLWFLHQLEGGGAVYNVPVATRLRGPLDVDALERAINVLVQRHESLRTGFTVVDGVPHQVISPARPARLEVIDLRAAADSERRGLEVVAEQARTAFDLSADELLRVALVKLADEDHLLSLTLHHIITDGWSMGVLHRELSTLYAGFAEGREVELPELPIQYADYAVWQQQWMHSGGLDAQLDYWRRQLAAAPTLIQLPTDRPRPAMQSFRGATVTTTLAPQLPERVRALGEHEGATLFMTLLAALAVMLSRYSGQEDVVIASPVANRGRVELEAVVGLLVNTLALRVQVTGEQSFAEIVRQARETALAAFANQDLPFEKLVEELNPERHLSHAPVAQVLLVVQNALESPITFPGLTRERALAERRGTAAKFDLSFFAAETAEGLRLSLEYCTDLFEEATALRMLQHYRALLEAAVSDPACPIDELPLLDADEREAVLAAGRERGGEYPVQCMHQAFERRAAAAPDTVAVSFEGQELTYGQLNAQSNQLAHRLIGLGAGPETLVALFLEPSLELVVAILGALKAGAGYLPLDPEHPRERLDFVLADAGAELIVTAQRLLERLSDVRARPVCLDSQAAELEALSTLNPATAVAPENLAYVIYTSGSTGRPKGVQVEHRQIARLFSATDEWFGFGPDDVWTLLHSYAFDFSVWELWGALAHGGRLVVSPVWTTRSPEALAALVVSSGVTVLNATPSLFGAVQDELLRRSSELAVRCIVFGGEALRPSALRPWFEHYGEEGPTLVNMYGITETTVHVTYRPLRAADCEQETSPIGVAIPDLSVYVLDRNRMPVPSGVAGELYVGGAGVARGYLNRPELTAERFIENPFGSGRLYRTGDGATRLGDGQLEFRGRIDDQVKIRGFRIEPGEIEAALREHAAVRQALVVAREDEAGEKRLVAYLITDAGATSPDDLHELLGRSLPDYMVPSAFVFLDAFPLTPNGKIDRAALPAPSGQDRASSEYAPPRTDSERRLAEIWSKVLGVEDIGINDNFFALGGHSLMAIKLVARVRDSLGVEVPLPMVFESPTIAAFAAAIDELASEPQANTLLPPIVPVARERRRIALPDGKDEGFVLPASFAEQRLWFLDQLEPDSTAYNVPLAMRLRGDLDVAAMEHALAALVARHESLRTRFAQIDGEPKQVITPPSPVPLTLHDLSSLPNAQEQAQRVVRRESRRRFDLAAGVMRADLVRLAADEHILLLTVHHIITDAWSNGVLNRELSLLYGGFVEGRAVQLPELPIQYADYAVWQQQWMQSGGLDEQLDYWSTQLAGAPTLLQLPTDRPRPAMQSFRGATVGTMLPLELLERVKALGEREGATLFMTQLAAFAVLLCRYSGQEDVVIASPVANRGRVELESVIGFLVNTLALRVDLEGEPSFGELVRRVRKVALGAFANQDLPFEKLVEELNPERHLSHAPVAQVLFVVQNAVESPITFPGLTRERALTERGTAKFDLSFFATETAEGLRLSLEYCTDLFEEATAVRMLEHYRALLEAAVSEPTCRIGQLSLSSDDERALVLGAWNQTARDYPLDSMRPVHELVSDQARRTPDVAAVRYAGEQLTYAQLEAQANQLARCLAGLGVQPGVVAAICAERSLEMVIAVLAVLKAGGAYAPIDPDYPEARVAFMLADTDAPVLLTQSHLLTRLPSHRARSVCLDADRDLINSNGDAPVATKTTLDDLAYVIYTSGSTGQPKGVAMEHRALANLLAWQLESFAAPLAARTLQFASLSFDVAFQEIFSTWCSGDTLVLIDEAVRRDAEALLAFIREQRVERVFLPFAALQNLCEAAAQLGTSVPSLREVITAGEQLKVTDAIRGFFAAHANCVLINQYGPTESHVVSAFELSGPAERWPALPPIGRPIANARLHLLDRHRQPVPIGVPGELHIGGVSLARGYLNRPELTSERFVAHPFSQDPEARLYRTGDLARHLPDGNIDYIGRSDHQIKVRGFRIEPGEIETALREHGAVRQALVVAREDDAGTKRLVAYLISEAPAPSSEELNVLLRRTLPDYMIPSAFVFLDAFPLTPNGKLDRAALPTPSGQGRASSKHLAPRTDTERRLAEIWTKVLGIEDISINDNFFALGGHSLMAVRLFAQIERKLGVRLPLSALFQSATIAGLAGLVERERGGTTAEWPSLVQLRAGDGQPPLFLLSWADGEVLPWRELVENLDSGLPVYGLRPPGVDKATVPLTSVEQLAAHYVEAMRGLQPHGPYRLGGFCFSGLVAYEMARLLRAQGEELALLALIDAVPHPPARRRRRFERVRRRFRAFTGADVRAKRTLVASYFAGFPAKARHAAYETRGPQVFALLESRNLHHLIPRRPLNLVYVASNAAMRKYVPKPADVRVELFRAQTTPDSRPTPWETLAGRGVGVRPIIAPDIDHERIMYEPHVRLLAAELTRMLDESADRVLGEA